MANLQYIGARYVPKFYENSLDPSTMDWESGHGYEPLTVVTYNSDTYTSKIPVPSTVGDPASNPTYWAKTADFNAALVALQNAVNDIDNNKIPAINDRIDEINGRPRYILIGDSYALGQNAGTSYGWFAQVKAYLGLTEGVDVFSYGANGYGFVGNLGTFSSLLATAINDITEPDTITDIFVAGGFNDIGDAGVATAIGMFCSTARAAFPKAKITIAYNGMYDPRQGTSLNGQQFLGTKNEYMTAGGAYRAIGDLYYSLLSDTGLMGSDGIHPTIAGYNALAKDTLRVILGGEVCKSYPLKSFTFTPDSEVTEGSGMQHYWRRCGDEVRFWFINFYLTCAFTSTSNTNNWFTVGTISNHMLNVLGGGTVSFAPFAMRVNTNDGVIHTVPAEVRIADDGTIQVRVPIFKSDGTRYLINEITLLEGITTSFAFPIDTMCI